MNDKRSVTKLTVPITIFGAACFIIAAAVYAWDDFNDRLAAQELKSEYHVRLVDLEVRMKTFAIQRLTDKMAVVQSAINFYNGLVAAGRALTEPQAKTFTDKNAELAYLKCEYDKLNGIITKECE